MRIRILFIQLIALFTWASCTTPATEKTVEKYQFVTPMIVDTSYINEYVAQIQSVKYVEVRSKLKGYIEKIHVDEGQLVQEGQLLFSIGSLEYEQELHKAVAAHKSALAELKAVELDFLNTKALNEKNIVSKAEFEMAQAKVEAMEAKVEEAAAHKEQAQLSLSYLKIKAPYHGIINRIPNKAGSLIEEGAMLTSISDNNEVFAYFNLSETDYLNYIENKEKKESKSVGLMLANNKLYNQTGTIEIIESEFDESTGNIAFRARFPNPDKLLRHGGNGKILVTKTLKNAMLIPQRAVFEIQDKMYVFTLTKDSVLKQCNVVRKMRIPHFFVLESGLAKEDQILFEGAQNARDGDKVIPEFIAHDKVLVLIAKD